ncbi:MAG: flap endonuclease [Lentisphaerae bacterium]|nr:flap endonuclease [Lentisphaerota bacterium]
MPSRLLLVDAHCLAYRAFYAVPGLATATGRPTNAVYGFIKTLKQMERLWQPSHKLVVFDGGLPAARLELLSTYKAQRPAMPSALREQLPVIVAWLDAEQTAHVRLEGQEADDVAASVAAQAAEQGWEVLMASSDKDLLQLVTPLIAVILPGKAQEKLGPAEVFAKLGVRPDQVVDFLALTGDSSDNIPGVPLIGAKTAVKLLQQWQSLANALDHAGLVEPEKVRRTLVEHRELATRNLLLLRLNTNLDSAKTLSDLAARPPDARRLRALYEELEFHTLAKALQEPTLF